MIEIKMATQDDIDFVRKNPIEEIVTTYPELKIKGYVISGFKNGILFGVGGVVPCNNFGEVWIILTKYAKEFPVTAYLTIKREIVKIANKYKFKYLRCIIREDFVKGKEMVEHLGFFYKNKILNCMPDGTDGYLYEMIL